MTDRIEPALSGEQWSEWRRALEQAGGDVLYTVYNDTVGEDAAECAQIIAYNNDALPDDDPRKITRALVERMRREAYNVPDGYSPHLWLADIADALESYLQPAD